MTAYYNEIDKQKAAWLRELIRAELIAPGDVDERSIADVEPAELMGYTQCHFFAGIGAWSYALRLAGWPDDRPCWTASTPCPSFSAAGKGLGFADPRHLWPEVARLARERKPPVLFGEQVAAAIGHGWLDLVQADLEAMQYAVGKAVLTAAGAGAPHIRQRLYFVGAGTHHAERWTEQQEHGNAHGRNGLGRVRNASQRSHADGGQSCDGDVQRGGEQRLLAEDCGTGHVERCPVPLHPERRPQLFNGNNGCDGQDAGRDQTHGIAGTRGEVLRSGDTAQRGQPMCGSAPGIAGHAAQSGEPERSLYADSSGCEAQWDSAIRPRERAETVIRSSVGERDNPIGKGLEGHFGDVREWRGPGWLDPLTARSIATTGATRGFWADCDWWYGRDGRYRPAGPGVLAMVDGSSPSMGFVRDSCMAEIEEEINETSQRHQIDAREAVLHLWASYAEETVERRNIGRLDGVWQAPVLFAFLRQLTIQGWPLTQGVLRESAEDAREMLRVVRWKPASMCPSCERGLDRQRPIECTDPLHLLSSILARHAYQAWGEVFDEDAKGVSPLSHGAAARVVRLRGYGDAINVYSAKAFIEAYREISQ